ncbi:MAG: hypothetical protein RBS80_21480 [Thermoguttaceae bacterium]|jgi:hypothetical protein|nr:hypothetical protein [Thermoguttaceae bacterium]
MRTQVFLSVVSLTLTVVPVAPQAADAEEAKPAGLRIGWATVDITPERPVLISGQFHARVSEGVMDPLSVTVLALESPGDGSRLVLVSCDLSTLWDSVRDGVREHLRRELPELDPMAVLLSATHTHSGPVTQTTERYRRVATPKVPNRYGVDTDLLDAMDPVDYVDWATARIADAVARAWRERAPGGIAFGLGHAVVGHNRLIAKHSGQSQMYARTDQPDFSHVEGYEDHSLHVLATYDGNRRLTGLVLNVACPSQVSESIYKISADFWHDTRVELRGRLGKDLFVLSQAAASGDQSPHVLVDKRAEARMERITGRSRRQQIATRIADGVTAILPFIEKAIDFAPPLHHRVETLPLQRRVIPESDSVQAAAEAEKHRKRYEEMLRAVEADPKLREKPRWAHDISRTYRMMRRHERVAERFELQQTDPTVPIEVHVARLGDVAFASSPFELYLDYGIQIQSRSKAVQTFVIQLAGPASYLPTLRSVAGGGYGAVPASTEIDPEGGRKLVEWTVEAINKFWE